MKAPKIPTRVSLVEDALKKADDFLTATQVAHIAGVKYDQANVALHHLQRYQACGVLVVDGVLWWYASPSTDTRSKVLDLRTPEDGPRKPKRRRGKLLLGTP